MLHVKGTSKLVDTSKLAGSTTAKFRVVASDGVNTGFADSAAFIMDMKAPVTHISLPSSNIKARWGQLINFSGAAIDLQDGQIIDANLEWTTGRTVIGHGPKITLSDLPNGVNIIRLTATNSKGKTSSATVTVTIDDSIEPDVAVLQVAPGNVTFNIDSGVTAVQSTALDTANFGSGGLTWQVSSDSAWLTTSAPTGSAGDSLNVLADPAGMVDGQILTGKLTFTATVNSVVQTVKVPVSLVMGNIYQSPYFQALSGYGLFLPLLQK